MIGLIGWSGGAGRPALKVSIKERTVSLTDKDKTPKGIIQPLLAGLVLAASLFFACAGGSLLNPRPLIGRDRLVFRVVDKGAKLTYFTRNLWFDGDNFRFHDVYGRDVSIVRNDSVAVDLISAYEYYKTP